MRRLTVRLIPLAACLASALAGCRPRVTSQTYVYLGREYQAVFNAVLAEMCGEKRILVIGADPETGILRAVIRGKSHPEIHVLVSRDTGGPAVTIPFPPGNAYIDKFLPAVKARLDAGAAAPGRVAPLTAPAAQSATTGGSAPAPAAIPGGKGSAVK